MSRKLVRTVSYFEKRGDDFVGEYPLVGIDLPGLQKLFGVDPEDPMYEVWPVGPREAEVLRDHVEGPIDFEKYDYFLECYTVEEEGAPSPGAEHSGSASSGR